MSLPPDPGSVLDALVRIPSHETERSVAVWLAERLGRLSARGVRVDLTPTPGAGETHPNVRATWGEGSVSLAFNSHMDTVPPSPGWTQDPFVPQLDGDHMIGLGAADAKGCLASMLAAFEHMVLTHRPDQGRLVYSAVSMEEGSGRGAEAEVRAGLRADAVIVGEPTDLEVCVAHKGVLRLAVTVVGRAAHAGEPWEGRNAIAGMHAVMDALHTLARRIESRAQEPVGKATLTVTTINGGTALNVVPSHCAIALDRRLLPRESAEVAQAEIEAAVQSACSGSGFQAVVERLSVGNPATTPRDTTIVRTALEALCEDGGAAHRPMGFGACCDMYHFSGAGGMPTIILGPGPLTQAHKAGERVSLTQVRRAAALYTRIAERWLGVTRA